MTSSSAAEPTGSPFLNSRGLPVIDSDLLDALFGSEGGAGPYLAAQPQRTREWFQILRAMAAFNLAYRQAYYRRLERFLTVSVGHLPDESRDAWLALALAIKEAYGMSDNTIARVMLEVRVRPV